MNADILTINETFWVPKRAGQHIRLNASTNFTFDRKALIKENRLHMAHV